MTFSEWLDVERGRVQRVAERFQCTPSAVSQWRSNGVPRSLILELHELIGDDVPLEELVRQPGAKAAA